MNIEFRKVKRVGNNCVADMFFDGYKVAEIHCMPSEFTILTTLLHDGNMANGGSSEQIVVSEA